MREDAAAADVDVVSSFTRSFFSMLASSPTSTAVLELTASSEVEAAVAVEVESVVDLLWLMVEEEEHWKASKIFDSVSVVGPTATAAAGGADLGLDDAAAPDVDGNEDDEDPCCCCCCCC